MVGNIWDSYVEANARRFGVPPALVQSVISAESGGRPNAVSRAGAGGLMQVMPNTYAELRQKHGLGEDRFDPANNIAGGTAYLAQLYEQFGNWPDAVAAYNAGPGRWAKVKAGTAQAPAETAAYVPKVMGPLGEQDVAMRPTPQAVQEGGNMAGPDLSFGAARAPRRSLTGLLEVEQDKNWYDGLGGLWNVGQTPSEPPRPEGPVADLPSQTERLDVAGRMNELMQGLLKPQARGPQMSPGQYMLAGAGSAVGQLAGVHDRKVGFGELLGALGGGLTRGAAAGEQAQQDRLGSEFDRLGKFATLQSQQRAADLNERNAVYDNRYKQALTDKARLKDATDPKVVGKWIYENGQWKAPPGQADAGGPFEGTAIDAQMYNQLVALEQKQASGVPLSPQETYTLALIRRHLTAPKQTVNDRGQVYEQTPPPLPQWGGQPSDQGRALADTTPAGSAPPPGAPPPASSADPPPTPQTVVTPSGASVTQVTPGGIPAGEQTELRKKIDTLHKLEGSVTTLGNNVEKTGLQIGGIGALGGTQSAMYEDLQTQLRLANELGVLNGPDERKLLEQISNPTKFMTYVKGLGGPSYFNAQMQVLKDKIAREVAQYEERLGIRKPDAGGGNAGGGGPTTVLKFDAQGNIIK